jgi:osmotically inducible protein OsmC
MMARSTPEWTGDLPTGTRTFTARERIGVDYTFKYGLGDDPGSDPVQLIAAAHASCFSKALSNILSQAGRADHSVQTEATVTVRTINGAPTITKIALVTVGRVPGLDELAFADYVLTAKVGCPVSRALAGVPEITLEALLVL